jgi:hypothetical protein
MAAFISTKELEQRFPKPQQELPVIFALLSTPATRLGSSGRREINNTAAIRDIEALGGEVSAFVSPEFTERRILPSNAAVYQRIVCVKTDQPGILAEQLPTIHGVEKVGRYNYASFLPK